MVGSTIVKKPLKKGGKAFLEKLSELKKSASEVVDETIDESESLSAVTSEIKEFAKEISDQITKSIDDQSDLNTRLNSSIIELIDEATGIPELEHLGYINPEILTQRAHDRGLLDSYVQAAKTKFLKEVKNNKEYMGRMFESVKEGRTKFSDSLGDRSIMTLEQMQKEGNPLMSVQGDVSATDRVVSRFGSVDLPSPVLSQGGPRFVEGKKIQGDLFGEVTKKQAEKYLWASELTTMKTYLGRMKAVKDIYGKDPRLIHTAMGSDALRHPMFTLDAWLQANVLSGRIPKEVLDSLSVDVRNATVQKKKPYADFKGFEDPNLYNILKNNAGLRKQIIHSANKAKYRSKGLTTQKDIEEAFTEAGAEQWGIGDTAFNTGVIDTSKPVETIVKQSELKEGSKSLVNTVPSDDPFHSTYSGAVSLKPGTTTGGIEIPLPFESMFLDVFRQPEVQKATNRVRRINTAAASGSPAEPEKLKRMVQQATDEWLEVNQNILDLAKKQRGGASIKVLPFVGFIGGLATLAFSDKADASIFISMLTEAVKSLPMKKGSVEQMVNSIKKQKGISAKEFDMIDWKKLEGQKKITQEELGEFVEAERPKINIVGSDFAKSKSSVTSNSADLRAFYDREWDDGAESLYDIVSSLTDESRAYLVKQLDKLAKEKGLAPSKGLYSESSGAWEDLRTNNNTLRIKPSVTDEEFGTADTDLYDHIKDEYFNNSESTHWLEERARYLDSDEGFASGSEFGGYTLSGTGKENYREIYFNLDESSTPKKFIAFKNTAMEKPFSTMEDARAYVTEKHRPIGIGSDKAADDFAKASLETKEYTILRDITEEGGVAHSGHMSGQPNNMAWARVTERVGPNGEKVLQIEEIQSDARHRKELKKALPKEWRKNVLNSVMAQAKEEGFDGVTFAKKPSQVAEIEKWAPVDRKHHYDPDIFKEGADLSNDEIQRFEEIVDEISALGESALSEGTHGNPFVYSSPSDGLSQIASDLEKIALHKKELSKSPNDIHDLDAGQVAEMASTLRSLESEGYSMRGKPSQVDRDDIASYHSGNQRVIKQYTEEFPVEAQSITGQPVQSLEVDGHDLNYVPLKDTDIPEPVFYGKPAKAAAAATAVGGAGTASASDNNLIAKDARYGELGEIPNPNGSTSTEFSITVNDPELGGWVNIPTLVQGQVDVDGLLSNGQPTQQQQEIAINRAKERISQGATLPAYGSVDEAVSAAESRTDEEKFLPYSQDAAPNVIAPSFEPVPGPATEPKPMTFGQQMFPDPTPESEALNESLKSAEERLTKFNQAVSQYADLTIKDKVKQKQTDPQAAAEDDSLFNQMLNAPAQAADYIEKQTGIPISEIAEDIYQVVTGEDRLAALPEDVRNLPEVGALGTGVGSGSLEGDLKIAYGRLFGNDEELRGVIDEQGGDFIEHQVGDGEIITEVILPTGERGLLNAPGASGADFTPYLGEAIQFTPAIKAVSMAKPLGAAAQTELGMGLFGASDLARQAGMREIGSGVEQDNWATAINSVFGAYPAAGPAYQAIKPHVAKLVNPIEEAYRKATGTIYNPTQ